MTQQPSEQQQQQQSPQHPMQCVELPAVSNFQGRVLERDTLVFFGGGAGSEPPQGDQGPVPVGAIWTDGILVGTVKINTETPAAPVWTVCRVRINQGTPASPNWVDAT